MRHLNQFDVAAETPNSSNIDLKLDINMSDFKTEIPYLSLLSDCDSLIKNEFTSDEELDFDFNTEHENSETVRKQGEVVKKNKRKTLVPQRAIQQELTHNFIIEQLQEVADRSSTSEENLFSQIDIENDLIFSDSELPESEDLLRDIDEENIFKGIQEEAGGYINFFS